MNGGLLQHKSDYNSSETGHKWKCQWPLVTEWGTFVETQLIRPCLDVEPWDLVWMWSQHFTTVQPSLQWDEERTVAASVRKPISFCYQTLRIDKNMVFPYVKSSVLKLPELIKLQSQCLPMISNRNIGGFLQTYSSRQKSACLWSTWINRFIIRYLFKTARVGLLILLFKCSKAVRIFQYLLSGSLYSLINTSINIVHGRNNFISKKLAFAFFLSILFLQPV